MSKPTTCACPICGHVLKPGEHLIARFIPKHNWWVVYHMPAEKDATNTGATQHVFDTYKSHCAQAGYTMSNLLFQKPQSRTV